MWWCAICIFPFLKFDNFIKGIVRIYIVFFHKVGPLFLYFTYLHVEIYITWELMYLSLIKLISKYGKRIFLIFYIHYIKLEKSQGHHFLFICGHFSFVRNAVNFWKVCFEKKAANIPFNKCLSTGLRRKLFWFLCRVKSFQSQNTY